MSFVLPVFQSICSLKPLCRLLCWRGARASKGIALTFDDGPNEHTTPRILKILEAEAITGTFFVLGREVAKCPGVLRAVHAAGHEIGIHGFDHTNVDVRGQIERCEAQLHGLGIPSVLFRPALGRRGLRELMWIRKRGYATVLWSFDAHDSMRDEGKWATVPDYAELRAGDIVLMHDDNDVCVEELPGVIETARKKGLELTTVSRLLGLGC